MSEKSRLTKKEAAHIVARYLIAYSTLFDRLDEDVYSGTHQGDLPYNKKHLAEKDGSLMVFFPNETERKLMKEAAIKMTRMLQKHLIPH